LIKSLKSQSSKPEEAELVLAENQEPEVVIVEIEEEEEAPIQREAFVVERPDLAKEAKGEKWCSSKDSSA
jgi:hypothetical protein